MKKIISVLALLSPLAIMVLPMIASAQATVPQECCKLKRDLGDIDSACTSTVNSTMIVGPSVMGEGTGEGECAAGAVVADGVTDNWGMCCLLNSIYNLTSWIFNILMFIVILMVIFGAFTLVTAGGDPEKIGKGRGYIMYAVIGMAVALLAKLIPSLVKVIVGM